MHNLRLSPGKSSPFETGVQYSLICDLICMYHTVYVLFPWSRHVEDTSPSKALEPSSAGYLYEMPQQVPHTPHSSSLNAEETQEMAQCAPSIQA